MNKTILQIEGPIIGSDYPPFPDLKEAELWAEDQRFRVISDSGSSMPFLSKGFGAISAQITGHHACYVYHQNDVHIEFRRRLQL